MLKAQEVQIQSICLLCGKEDESIGHMFNCEYSRALLLRITEYLNQALWKNSNTPTPSLIHPDIRIDDTTKT